MATDEDDLTAAELALNLLEGEERAAALRRMLAEPGFAHRVAGWQAMLAPLFDEAREVEPPASVSARIRAIPSADRTPERRWRWIAGLSSAAAAAMLVALIARPTGQPHATVVDQAQPSLIAVMTPTTGTPFGAVVTPQTREVRLSTVLQTPAGRIAELWAIGGDGVPRAAGLLAGAQRRALTLPAALPVGQGITLAISIEAPGGSAKPVPSGPVVATGKLVAL